MLFYSKRLEQPQSIGKSIALMDILNFLYRRLGFGNFIFKGKDG